MVMEGEAFLSSLCSLLLIFFVKQRIHKWVTPLKPYQHTLAAGIGLIFYNEKQDDSIIDLGLSLRTLQPEAYHPSGQWGYDDLINWPQSNLNLKNPSTMQSRSIPENLEEETEGVQSKERWAYVKVNMDGITIGRKICVLDHGGYSGLAIQLEDMFGKQCVSGLRLFQAGSEYSLFYKDREENWRAVGDVPWKEFVERVKRLRIARNSGAFVPCNP